MIYANDQVIGLNTASTITLAIRLMMLIIVVMYLVMIDSFLLFFENLRLFKCRD